MIQDYFSLDKKGNNYLLLRIINKVLMFPCVNYLRVFTYLNRSSTF